MEVSDTYPLLLCGYKRLEARGDTKAQLMNKWGLRLAVDLHPHTCLEGCILWREDRWKDPMSWFTQPVNRNVQTEKTELEISLAFWLIWTNCSEKWGAGKKLSIQHMLLQKLVLLFKTTCYVLALRLFLFINHMLREVLSFLPSRQTQDKGKAQGCYMWMNLQNCH